MVSTNSTHQKNPSRYIRPKDGNLTATITSVHCGSGSNVNEGVPDGPLICGTRAPPLD